MPKATPLKTAPTLTAPAPAAVKTHEPIFDVPRAAEYCHLAPPTLRYHIYVAKDLVPDLPGTRHVFYKSTLDAFLERRRPAHRPPAPLPKDETARRRRKKRALARAHPDKH